MQSQPQSHAFLFPEYTIQVGLRKRLPTITKTFLHILVKNGAVFPLMSISFWH